MSDVMPVNQLPSVANAAHAHKVQRHRNSWRMMFPL